VTTALQVEILLACNDFSWIKALKYTLELPKSKKIAVNFAKFPHLHPRK